jgi:ribonuclease P protein component
MRHKDHAMPTIIPRPLLGKSCLLDIRIWCWDAGLGPTLLVNASKKFGRAVQRNYFRRQVRMALLNILREQLFNNGKGYIIWVRPSKSLPKFSTFLFQDIEDQIRLALCHWEIR